MRGLAQGEKGYEKFPELFKKHFVFLNVYCRSVAEEHNARGPEGPYQFKDRSVPVLVSPGRGVNETSSYVPVSSSSTPFAQPSAR